MNNQYVSTINQYVSTNLLPGSSLRPYLLKYPWEVELKVLQKIHQTHILNVCLFIQAKDTSVSQIIAIFTQTTFNCSHCCLAPILAHAP